MNKRLLPRYAIRVKTAVVNPGDKKMIGEAETVDISLRGVCFATEAELQVGGIYVLIVGYVRFNKLEVTGEILSRYQKNGRQCYSARFVEKSVLEANKIRAYLEGLRSGKY